MSQSSNTPRARRGVDAAIAAFAAGEPVLIHDAADREGEVDLVYPAAAVTPDDVARMRNDAGGLVCVALSDTVCTTWELPFMQEVVDHPAAASHELGYDERSSFSLTVNHRDTFTGITDDDRALTISKLGEAAGDAARATAVAGDGAENAIAPDTEAFAETFRAPGHVHLLRAAPNLLDDREGHTELGIALAEAAGVEPAVVVCEMMDDETGGALAPAAARAYADRNGFAYVEGSELLARFK
ncbi:MAG: 3,4-dihydroxy 2-butanone 4-phosphate synthase [Natronomonas sp.]|jgi:3,4-dihydroxy 2-butanone 4-phosphate synthase|uniref:3,4-dihydroxy-2-butanone-4-phosphate synthase n=1 Tax=Natronomonas sp. TaxID=2184060 RepID=UPI0039891F3D